MSWLIAIGGRGQAVVSSYLRLAILCGLEPVRMAIIDADQEGEAIRNIVELSARWCDERVVQINPYPDLPLDAPETYQFKRLIEADDSMGYAQLVFIDSDDSLGITIKEGMRGNPSVGSSVFLKKIRENISQIRDENLRTVINNVREQRVALVGSTFGGTGSGGLPKFVDFLRAKGARDLAAVSFLPYFQLQAKLRDDYVQRTNEKMERNPAGNVYYFRDKMVEWVNRLILFGIPDGYEKKSMESDGFKNQKELTHFFHLLAALELNNYFLAGPDGDERTGRGKIYGYWFNPDIGVHISRLTIKKHIPPRRDDSLTREIQIGGDVQLLLGQFINYLRPLPRAGFFPDLTVPVWLGLLLRQLDSSEERGIDRLRKRLIGMYDDMQRCRKWLLDTASGSLTRPLFAVSEDKGNPDCLLFEKKMRNPMSIFQNWMRGREDLVKSTPGQDNDKVDDLIRLMMKRLREEVDKRR